MMIRSLGFVSLVVLLLASGCAQRPDVELNAAQEELKNAAAAEAGVYAPEALKAAEDQLSAAKAEIAAQEEAFFLGRSFENATNMLADAKAKATAAVETAKANKEQVRQECEQLKAQAESAIAMATEMLAKAPKGKGSKADLEAIQGDLDGLGAALQQAAQTHESGQYMTARDELQSVISKADAISAEIETAILKKGRR